MIQKKFFTTPTLFVAILFLSAQPVWAQLPANVFTDPEVDIAETWEGMAVSGKFGENDAWHSFAGVIEGYSETMAAAAEARHAAQGPLPPA